MSKTRHEFEIDYGPIVQGFDMIRDGVNANDQEIKGLSKDTKTAFDSMTNSAKNYNRELTGTAQSIVNIQNETKKEVETIRQLTAARKLSNDPAKIAAYNRQIDSARNRIKQLNATQKQGADENKKSVNEAAGLIDKLLSKEKQLTEMRNKSNNTDLIKRYNKLLDETRQKVVSLTQAEKKEESAKKGGFFEDGVGAVLGGNILFSAVQKIKDGFADMVAGQVQFEKSIQNLSAITGASGEDLVFYGDQAIEMGRKVEGGAVAAVEAYKLIGSAKPELLKNKEALVEVTEAAITLSQASGLTLPEAATNLGQALNAFDESADKSTKFINVFAAAAQLGAQEIPFLTEALSKFGGVAKGAGVSIEESAAAIEVLGQKIPEATTVGTNLRNILIILQTEAAKQGRAFKGLSGELDLLAPKLKDVGFLEQTFGRENLLATQILITQREELKKMTEGVTNTNSAIEQAATNTDTWAQSLIEAGNAYDELLLSISNSGLGTILRDMTDGFSEAFKDLAALFRGEFLSKENILAITQLSNTTEAQAKRLDKFGLSLKDYYDLTAEESETINTLLATDLVSKQITSIELADKALVALNYDLIKLTDGFVKGNISTEAYNVRLKILTDSINKAKDAKKEFNKSVVAPELEAQVGIIEKLQKEITALTEARTKSVSVTEISRLNIQIKSKQDELDRLLGKENSKLKQAKEEFERAITDLRKRAAQAKTEALTGEERIAAEQKFFEEELQITKDHFVKLGLATDKKFKISAEQEEQFQVLLNAIRKKAADESIKLEVDRQAAIDAQRKQSNEQTLQGLSEEEAGKINTVTGVRKPQNLKDFQERDFEEAKQLQILDIQEEYAKKRLDLKLKTIEKEQEAEKLALQKQLVILGNADTAETNAKRAKLNNDIAILDQRYELEGIKIKNEVDALINDIQNKRDQLNKQKPFSLREFLGLSQNDANNLQIAANEITAAMHQVLQNSIDAKDREISASQEKQNEYDNEIEKLKAKFENEQDIADRGKANNKTRIQAEIAEIERRKEKEIAIQKKAQEEKKKLQKQQLLIDSITQASNIFVASSEILANTAKDPVSLAIALAAIGTMIAGFAISKSAALKAIEEGNNYKDGVIDLKGPGTETSDSIRANLSKGESVMTAKETRDHKKGLLAIRNDDDTMFKEYLFEQLSHRGIDLPDNLPEVVSMKKEALKQQEINAYLQTDNSKMEKELQEVKNLLSELLAESKKETYNNPNGDLVRKTGTHTFVIKK